MYAAELGREFHEAMAQHLLTSEMARRMYVILERLWHVIMFVTWLRQGMAQQVLTGQTAQHELTGVQLIQCCIIRRNGGWAHMPCTCNNVITLSCCTTPHAIPVHVANPCISYPAVPTRGELDYINSGQFMQHV
jgi:hypothetical protein